VILTSQMEARRGFNFADRANPGSKLCVGNRWTQSSRAMRSRRTGAHFVNPKLARSPAPARSGHRVNRWIRAGRLWNYITRQNCERRALELLGGQVGGGSMGEWRVSAVAMLAAKLDTVAEDAGPWTWHSCRLVRVERRTWHWLPQSTHQCNRTYAPAFPWSLNSSGRYKHRGVFARKGALGCGTCRTS